MTDEKILKALEDMKQLFPRGMPRFEPKRIDPEVMLDVDGFPPTIATEHLLFMCDEIKQLVLSNRREKAFRWLGFLQGAVWAFGLTNLEELKKMNMPEPGRGILDVG